LKPVSVFSLHQELFGIELSSIQEFIQFNKVTPIPCTPNFVLGNINLRGEVITLMDVRSFFNLPQSHRFQKEGRAIIVNVQGIVAGLLVDHIHDIFMLDPKQLVTDQTVETEINQDFCQGVIPYQDKMLAIIDLLPLVQGDRLLVDEAV
ncbi:MAG: chemotaxis protein CheW, partial [Merismopediaceae bacterium]|nr:chemotaxis protein CheW [Merismopediaceae bacterium]